MYLVEEHYYAINKMFLKALGIWPYEKSSTVLVKRCLILLVTVPHMFMQLSVFFTMEYTMVLFLRVASLTGPIFGMFMHYGAFIWKTKAIVNMHLQIREDWKLLRDKMESNIIQQNCRICRIFIQLIFSCIGFVIIATSIIQLFPVILDIFSPLNESRPRELLLVMDYFVVRNEYFYYKVLYELVFVALCWTIASSTGTQFIAFFFHSFGMFKIARYRIEHSLENCVMHIPHSQKKYAICSRIMHATIAHRRAMEFIANFVSSFNALTCFIAVFLILCLIIDLYGIFDALMVSRSFHTLVVCLFSGIGVLVYMFLSYYFGQLLTDYNKELSLCIYSTSWYLMPISSQKLILFLIQRTNKDYMIKLGHIFTGKLETFATVLRVAMSYVTVLYNCSDRK